MAGQTAALGICAVLLSIGASGSAAGQDLAETAQINSGIVQQRTGAERSLAGAISRRLRASGDALGVPADSRSASIGRGSGRAVSYQPYTIPANVDALAGTEAPTYRLLGNDVLIRISWDLRPSPNVVCIAFCP